MAKPRPYNDRRRVRHRTSAPVKKTARHRPTHAPKADDRPGFATGVIRRRGTHTQAAGIGSDGEARPCRRTTRSEEHTSELQSLMRISYAVFCLKEKTFKQ